MNKFFQNLKFKVLGISAIISSFVVAGVTQAAVDADLTATMASGTAMVTDNKGQVLTYIAGLVAVTLVIALGKAGLYKAKGMIIKAFKK